MTRAIKMPLRSLKPEMISDYQEMYPGAVISIEVPENREERALSDEAFWKIIALLDWTQEGNDELIIKPAVIELSKLTIRHIVEFEDILSEKLYMLDRADIAAQTVDDLERISVDGFLYDRCVVVANGKELFESVLEDPTKMPKDLSFSTLLNLTHEAFLKKTGRELSFRPRYSYETYSNKSGWPT